MEHATQSKKAMQIETKLLNKLAMIGQNNFAKAMKVPEYTVSRWKAGLFKQVSMMLAVLEYGVEDEDLARLAKTVAQMLTKEKAPSCVNSFEA
ncbi:MULTISPECIES: CII family transcriptional regulator [Rahnella]|uniref:Uncharacterized protein n=1 Tax=Rahnella laticis TaxID=2787622 RepID=A0ABS0E475_9GAMM|nr:MULTISPECIES: CII family transcriptional regulator [Rahnella]MBF7978089.1 hypothetical protein [Rahnella laticis]MBF7998194.1 hypothetical protein [Rahnella sp. LAC-M12]